MDFFNNHDDNSKRNEMLLDAIMEEQKNREEKYNIKKGYLLKKRKTPVSNPFEKDVEDDDRDFKHNSVNTLNNGKPVFVVNGKGTFRGSKNSISNKNKLIIALSTMALILVAAIAFCCVFFFSKHNIKIVCGNIEGITITNTKNDEINKIQLRMYESFSFKITVNENYSNSIIEVWYNNVELEPNEKGFYTIKFNGENAELRITGVVENDYDVVFENVNGLTFQKLKEDNTFENITTTQTNYYGTNLKFRVVDNVTNEVLKEPYIAIYNNNKLMKANENGIFEVFFDKNQTISGGYHSPYEYFNILNISENETPNYVVSGLTELGLQSKVLKFPSKYNNYNLTYDFFSNNYYNQTQEIIMNSDCVFDQTVFDYFVNLENINVLNSGEIGYYSLNGLLYEKVSVVSYAIGLTEEHVIEKLIKVPSGYGRNLEEGARILNINPDEICTNAINRLNYIKTIYIGSKTSSIQPLALKGAYNQNNYTINIENSEYFVVENNVIYTKDKTEIVAAPAYSGEFSVPNNVKIRDNAFSFSNVTKLSFEENATLSNYALNMMENVKTIVLPTNTANIYDIMFFGNINLEVIDLRNVVGTITISPTATDNWSKLKYIVVPDAQLENYKNANAETIFANLFISASEFDKK